MREEIREIINNMGADEQVAIHNRYCDEVGYSDDEIFSVFLKGGKSYVHHSQSVFTARMVYVGSRSNRQGTHRGSNQ